jgi:hypothetical protein
MPKISELSAIGTSLVPGALFPISIMSGLIGSTYSTTLANINAARAGAVAPEQFGAVGDGVTDDTAAIALAYAAGHVWLSPGRTYLTTYRIDCTTDGRWFLSDPSNPAIVLMDTTYFNITNQGDDQAANGCAFYFNGVTGGGFHGVRVRPNVQAAELCCIAIVAAETIGFTIDKCEFDNFSISKVVRFNSVFRNQFTNNYVHDCHLDSASASPVKQLTGLDIDDRRPNGPSIACIVTGNRFINLTVSAGYVTLDGYESDGINVAHFTSNRHIITNNYFESVGEGIDSFAFNCQINNNYMLGCYNAGVKLYYGASRNQVMCNHIYEPGLYGIVVGGVSSGDTDTEYNQIVGNIISGVNAAGQWNAAATTGIRMENATGSNKYAARNYIANNLILDGGAMKYGMLSTDDSRYNVFKNNYVESFTISEYTNGSTEAATETYQSAKTTNVQVYRNANQSVPTATWTRIVFDTETVDSLGEYATGTGLYTTTVQRRLLIVGTLRTTGATAATLWEMRVRKSGTLLKQLQLQAPDTGELSMEISEVTNVSFGQNIEIEVRHNEAGSVDITGGAEWTNLRVVEVL